MPEDSTPTPLAKLIHTLRTEAGLSMYELEQRSGVGRSQLHRLEHGQTTNPGMPQLQKLARALDTDVEELYEAVWQTNQQPLPSMPTYFRSRYALTREQIEQMQSLLDTFDADSPGTQTPEHPA
jgi:transcriptional regulator with XRE-family HTH domain